MSLFRKLFGKRRIEVNPNKKSANIKPKRTIFDFFKIDIKNIPDDSFIAGETEENSSREKVYNFRKSLDYKECGIFDTVEVKLIGEESSNVFLKSFNPEKVDFNKLKCLIDDLYLIYGNDSEDKGKFTIEDKEDYNDSKFYMLFGRMWTDYSKYKYPVYVTRDEGEISISIWGVNK